MATSHAFLKQMRQIHLWFGVFISPMLLFFAFTGALQTFSLHETTQGSNYKPPALFASLAQIHKKQTYIIPPRRQQPAKPAPDATKLDADKQTGAPAAPPAPSVPPKSHLPLKIFFLVVSIGLFTSTLTGIYMAYKFNRNAWLVSGLLVAGIVLPIFLVGF